MNGTPLQPSLFSNCEPPNVPTEGIKYIGSKLRIIPYILEIAQRLEVRTVFDGFSGSTRVSQAFAQIGCDVISSDVSHWSEVFANCYLQKERKGHIGELIAELNALKPRDGWFTEHYGGDANYPVKNGYKKPWQRHNTRKLDAIRETIDNMNLAIGDKAIALTSLILALDKVDNTLGHFSSYLKEWSPRSYHTMKMREPLFTPTDGDHAAMRGDIFDILNTIPEVDLAYFDPPYGSNNEKMPPSRVRYASYYHIWKTICLNDKPKLFGKARRRADTRDTMASSIFEDFRRDSSGRFRAVKAIERMIQKVRARHVLLSYSSGGRATAAELIEVLHHAGNIEEIVEIEYKRNVMSSMRWTNEWIPPKEGRNIEYLFLLEKL